MSKIDKKRVRAAFRKAVLGRDGYRCKVCGESGTDETLDPHHVTPRESMPNGGYVKENGIALCKKSGGCHEKAEEFLQRLANESDPVRAMVDRFSPPSLYKLIGSSSDEAYEASKKLEDGV